MVETVEESIYIIKCLSCGLWGPEREDALQAKVAFEESSEAAR